MKKLYVQPFIWFFESFDSFVYTVLCWKCRKDFDICPDLYVCPIWKIRVEKEYMWHLF